MAFCTNCGKNVGDAKFCPGCGKQVGQVQPAAGPPGPPRQQAPAPAGAPPAMTQPGPGPGQPAGSPFTPVLQPGVPPIPIAQRPVVKGGSGVQVFGIIGAAAMVLAGIGSFLPWVKAGAFGINLTASGWDKDGKVTIILALLALVFFVLGLALRARWQYAVGLGLSLILTAVAVIDIVDVASTRMASVGIGLYLVAAAGIVGVVAGIGGIVRRS